MNGYAFGVATGKVKTLAEFATECLPFVGMHPDVFVSVQELQQALDEVNQELGDWEIAPKENLEYLYRIEYLRDVEIWSIHQADRAEQTARLNEMLAKVNSFIPPKESYRKLKNFMQEILVLGLDACKPLPKPKQKKPAEWRDAKIADLQRKKAELVSTIAKETELEANQTEWLNDLLVVIEK